jgi:hypothetical protein
MPQHHENRHHGMTELEGMHAFCHIQHTAHAGDRFGRMFALPALYTNPDHLIALGAQGGPMDGGTTASRTQTVPVGHVFFGQFVDHDITLDTTSSLSRVADPAATPNIRTPTLDLDCVYGQGPEAHPYLFHSSGPFANIKLLTGADGTATAQPANLAQEDLCRTAQGTAIIGDPRNDENRVVSQLQLAMIRFHNHVVDEVAADGLTGHDLYEEARRLATWHYQWVVINDFLRAMCGSAVVDDILGNGRRFYCATNGTPYIPIEFAVAAYRFGHSMIPQRIQIQKGGSLFDIFGPKLGRGFSPLDDSDAIVDWHELVPTSLGRTIQMAERLDTKMAALLLNLPFLAGDPVPSLAARNLLRGQSFLLPSGEQVAAAIGRSETEIAGVRQNAQALAGSAIDLSSGTPLWFYLLVEAEEVGRETHPNMFDQGEGLGPVGARIVAETLIGLVELDPRSYLGRNRNWRPSDGVGTSTLGEMLTLGAAA